MYIFSFYLKKKKKHLKASEKRKDLQGVHEGITTPQCLHCSTAPIVPCHPLRGMRLYGAVLSACVWLHLAACPATCHSSSSSLFLICFHSFVLPVQLVFHSPFSPPPSPSPPPSFLSPASLFRSLISLTLSFHLHPCTLCIL